MEIAAAAVALLAPYLSKAAESVAGRAGEAAAAGGRALLGLIRRKFEDEGDEKAQETLTRLEEKPEEAARQEELTQVLSEKLANDPTFREELQKEIDSATGGRPVNEFLTQVYGGEVGKLVNIGQVDGDVSF